MQRTLTEPTLLLLIGAAQFANILDFMLAMPLGADFARALAVPTSELGLIAGSYTLAAALTGLLGMFFLDRFGRRVALGLALCGLALGTFSGGLAWGLGSLLAARLVAGAFGGPVASLSLAIIADVVPPERRGRALGVVMGAFALASVLGVPVGLELARLGGWRLPFFAVGALVALVAAGAFALLPPLTGHLAARSATAAGPAGLLRRPVAVATLAAVALVMLGNFAVIPNLSAYVLFNLSYPRQHLGLLYLAGGMVSFATMQLAGRLVDRVGAAVVGAGGTALYVATLFGAFLNPFQALPALGIVLGMMASGSFRIVPMQTLATRVPAPGERARFMSAQACVQHLAGGAGAVISSRLLTDLPDGRLVGMDSVAWLAIGLNALVPALFWVVETRLRQSEPAAVAA